jgi:hypothetical protein
MTQEYKGTVSVPMLGHPQAFRYRGVYGVQFHVLDCYTNDGDRYIMLSQMPESVQVRVLDAIVADVREQEQARMGERSDA